MQQWIFPLFQRGTSPRNPKIFGRERARLLGDEEDSSDAADSPVEEKVSYDDTSRARPMKICGRMLPILQCLVVTILGAANFSLLVLVWMGRVKISWTDGNALPPEMSISTPKVFSEELAFSIYSQDRGVAAWKELTANFDIGKVFVSDPGSHSLFNSELNSDLPGYEMYPIAMYHQIHCLGTIREVFYTLNISEADAYGNHIGHCFDYLRLSLLCSADLTLEYTVDGMEVEHNCKDPKEVDAFMKAHNADVQAMYAQTIASKL